MKEIFELPPMSAGTVEQQLQALREYLTRLVLAINERGEGL